MEKFNTGGLRPHEMIYSLDTGRLMGDPISLSISLDNRNRIDNGLIGFLGQARCADNPEDVTQDFKS